MLVLDGACKSFIYEMFRSERDAAAFFFKLRLNLNLLEL